MNANVQKRRDLDGSVALDDAASSKPEKRERPVEERGDGLGVFPVEPNDRSLHRPRQLVDVQRVAGQRFNQILEKGERQKLFAQLDAFLLVRLFGEREIVAEPKLDLFAQIVYFTVAKGPTASDRVGGFDVAPPYRKTVADQVSRFQRLFADQRVRIKSLSK